MVEKLVQEFQATGANSTMNQSEFLPNLPVTHSKHSKIHTYIKVQLVLVLPFVPWKTGVRFLI